MSALSFKTFWIILYVIFIAFLTYFVATLSQASKVVDFLSNQEEVLLEDEQKLILASAIANRHDGTDAYTLQTPLYEEYFTSDENQIHVAIYPVALFDDNQEHHMIAILANDINISGDNVYVDEDDYHQIKINIEFDREITIGEQSQSIYTESVSAVFEDETRLFLIDTARIMTDTGQAEIERLSFLYRTTFETDATLVNLYNSTLTTIDDDDLFALSFDRDISQVTSENLNLIEVYGTTDINQYIEIYYDETLIETYRSYGWYIFAYIGIEFLVVAMLSYFLFFHKIVMRARRKKQDEKRIIEQEKYEKIKAELKEKLNKD